jgi:acetyl esterase/lipase
LSQHAIFPAQIYDCKAAVRWLRAHARQYELDSEHIGAWGSSAGGHLVALMGTTNGLAKLEGDVGNTDQRSDVQAVVDWFGPTDFLTVGAKETRTRLLGGDPQQHKELAMQASPMHHVSKNAPPFLIMHGDQDKTVPMSQSEDFAQALKALGADAEFLKIEGAGHGGKLFKNSDTMQRIEDFFAKHLSSTR